MAKKSGVKKISPTAAAPSVPPAAGAASNTDRDTQSHYVQNLYDGAKGVWHWGKGLAVVGGAFGLAEGVAQKALGVVGTDLQHVDRDLIEPKLVTPLDSFASPALDAVLGVVHKTTDTVVPPVAKIIQDLINALHLKRILGQQDDTPSATTVTTSSTLIKKQENPELTTPSTATATRVK